MSDETKVPAIPSVTGVIDPQVRSILSAIKEVLEVRDGRRGQALDRFVTLRELDTANVVSIGFSASGSRLTVQPGDSADYTTPPAPINLVVTGGYTQMHLGWEIGTFKSFSHVEIWRSTEDALGTATLIGQTSATLYSDACGSGRSYYYWVRAVNKASVTGPYNAVGGVFGQTSEDVEFLLTKLQGQITESQLYADLSARIDLIDDAKAVTTTVNQRLDSLYSQVENGFVSQDSFNSYVSADQAFAEQVRAMAFVDDTDGKVSALEGVIITQDNDRNNAAIRFDAIEADVSGNTARIASEEIARANADSSLTSSLDSALSRIGASEAAIVSEQTTRADADSALTSAVNTLSTTVGGNTASIQTNTTSINGLSAQYSVKIDNNGMVSGFGLASTPAEAGGSTSAFGIRADKFWIAAPGASETTSPETANTPFVVSTGGMTIDGVTLPAGVWMNSAFIANGTITNAKIGTAAIDDAKIASLSASKVTFGEMSGARIAANTISADRLIVDTLAARLSQISTAYVNDANIGNYIQSSGYDFGGAGWNIDKYGAITSRSDPLQPGQASSYDYTQMTSGNVISYKWFPGVGHQEQRALNRTEVNVVASGSTCTLGGYWEKLPDVVVTPYTLPVFDPIYYEPALGTNNPRQSVTCMAVVSRKSSDQSSPDYYKINVTPTAVLNVGGNGYTTAAKTEAQYLPHSATNNFQYITDRIGTVVDTVNLMPFVNSVSFTAYLRACYVLDMSGATWYIYRSVRFRIYIEVDGVEVSSVQTGDVSTYTSQGYGYDAGPSMTSVFVSATIQPQNHSQTMVVKIDTTFSNAIGADEKYFGVATTYVNPDGSLAYWDRGDYYRSGISILNNGGAVGIPGQVTVLAIG